MDPSLAIVELLSFVSGRALLIDRPPEPGCAWYWNGEDPYEELQRRIQAACLHYGIRRTEIEGRLFVDDGRSMPIVIAREERNDLVIAHPVVEAVIGTIRDNGIDIFSVDPFISSHRVDENDNAKIQAVADQWARIADETCCAIELIHHPRKSGGGELTAEDARGASALVAKARSVRVLNRMSKDEAAKAGIEDHRSFFRVDASKGNLAPPSEKAVWRTFESVDLAMATSASAIASGSSSPGRGPTRSTT